MLLVPWHASDEYPAKFHVIARHEIHLSVQRIPGPLSFLWFDIIPRGMTRAHHMNANCGHLWNPPRIILRRTIVDVATADSKRAQARAGSLILQFTRGAGAYYRNRPQDYRQVHKRFLIYPQA